METCYSPLAAHLAAVLLLCHRQCASSLQHRGDENSCFLRNSILAVYRIIPSTKTRISADCTYWCINFIGYHESGYYEDGSVFGGAVWKRRKRWMTTMTDEWWTIRGQYTIDHMGRFDGDDACALKKFEDVHFAPLARPSWRSVVGWLLAALICNWCLAFHAVHRHRLYLLAAIVFDLMYSAKFSIGCISYYPFH